MRTLRSQAGYTLIEVLVAASLLALITAGVFGVQDIVLRTYARAVSYEEAQSSARSGLERMLNELRFVGAFHYLGVGTGTDPFLAASATSVTFLGDIDADTVNANTETTLTATALMAGTVLSVTGTATEVANRFSTFGTAANNDWVYVGSGANQHVARVAAVAGTNVTLATGLNTSYPAGTVVRAAERVTYTFDAGTGNLNRTHGGGAAEPIASGVAAVTFSYFDAAGAATAVLANIREVRVTVSMRGEDGSLRTMTSRVRPRSLS